MGLAFREDPMTGCACHCGEYLQELRGFFRRDEGTGVMRDVDHWTVSGLLDRSTFKEDARGQNPNLPYGHRDVSLSDNDGDLFLSDPVSRAEDRASGCHYDGDDAPGMTSDVPGERLEFRLEFRGAPVDACHGRTPIRPFRHWLVEWSGENPNPRRRPRPPRPRRRAPPVPGGDPRGTAPLTPHRPTRAPVGVPRASRYAGGTLPSAPDPADRTTRYTVLLAFLTDDGAVAVTSVEVTVVAVTATHVRVRSTNAVNMDVSPVTTPPHSPVVLAAHNEFEVARSAIARHERVRGAGP
jgi:hypothetical protein